MNYPAATPIKNGMSTVERILRGSCTPASDLLSLVGQGTLSREVAISSFKDICRSADIDTAAMLEQQDMTRRDC